VKTLPDRLEAVRLSLGTRISILRGRALWDGRTSP